MDNVIDQETEDYSILVRWKQSDIDYIDRAVQKLAGKSPGTVSRTSLIRYGTLQYAREVLQDE